VKQEVFDTHSKALKINLDPRWYGTFAEIGAGQEVVRWFFRVGGAAGTVAVEFLPASRDQVAEVVQVEFARPYRDEIPGRMCAEPAGVW